jgi:hypothetical protein
MSAAALHLAVRDRIRASLALGADSCRCVADPEGRPPNFAGALFVAVHPGPWRGGDIEGSEEEFGALVTATLRAAFAPAEAQAEEIWLRALDGLDAVCRRICRAVVSDVFDAANPPVLNRANAQIGASANGFVQKLRLVDGGRALPRGAEWFGAALAAGRAARHGQTAYAGLSQTLALGGARRFQGYESMNLESEP